MLILIMLLAFPYKFNILFLSNRKSKHFISNHVCRGPIKQTILKYKIDCLSKGNKMSRWDVLIRQNQLFPNS